MYVQICYHGHQTPTQLVNNEYFSGPYRRFTHFCFVSFFLVICYFSSSSDYNLEKMSEILALDRRMSPCVSYPIHFPILSRSSVSETFVDKIIQHKFVGGPLPPFRKKIWNNIQKQALKGDPLAGPSSCTVQNPIGLSTQFIIQDIQLMGGSLKLIQCIQESMNIK